MGGLKNLKFHLFSINLLVSARFEAYFNTNYFSSFAPQNTIKYPPPSKLDCQVM